MRARSNNITQIPRASLRFLRGCILSAHGSAPGVDGRPYEIYHLHPQLFACLRQQAFLCLPDEPLRDPWGLEKSPLDQILGPPVDLLVWIPKATLAHLISQQRPLQLPNCLGRLFGSACARLLSPSIEPQLDKGQAAVAGGSCYQNIAKAFRHLAQLDDPERPPLQVPHTWWSCQILFGAAAAAVIQLCKAKQRRAHPDIRRTPACLLLDQAKAFEMLTHEWLRAVLRAWNAPPWAVAAFLSFVEGRKLQDKMRRA